MKIRRIRSIVVTAYFMDDLAIWDARVYHDCPCCGSTTWTDYYSITFSRVIHLYVLSKCQREKRRGYGAGFCGAGYIDSLIRFQQEGLGAYAFNSYGHYWMNDPLPRLILEDGRTNKRNQARKLSESEMEKVYTHRELEYRRGLARQLLT